MLLKIPCRKSELYDGTFKRKLRVCVIRMMNILLVALINEFNSICVKYDMNELY